MRSSTLQNNTATALIREIDSRYDVIKSVGDKLAQIEAVASIDIVTLLADLESAKDFTGITVVTGAVAGWDPQTKILTVPVEKGDDGSDGNGISSITLTSTAGRVKTYTITFSDLSTTQFTVTDGANGLNGANGKSVYQLWLDAGNTGDINTFLAAMRGPQGATGATGVGIQGLPGADGQNLTIEQIVYNNDGTFTWQFSDDTSYTTPNLIGPQGAAGSKGDKGDQGISVHHLKGTTTTNPLGDFGAIGFKDTYTLYGDANETIVLGSFVVGNGFGMDQAVYDSNMNGIIDNSERLGGNLPEHFVDIVTDQNIAGNKEFSNNVTIQGDLIVNGTQTTVNSAEVTTADNQIVLNNGEVGSGVTAGKAGIRVDRGTATDYEFVFDESDDSFKIGESGSLQKVATREDAPIDGGIAVWDDAEYRFTTTQNPSVSSLSVSGHLVSWNSDENTLDVSLNGATLQVGQEQLIRVRNNSGVSITNGMAVMATGTIGNSGRITVAKANLTQANAKYILGVVTETIDAGADGFCTTFGKVRGIQTNGAQYGETWLDGDVLYVKDSGNGALTKVVPTDSQVKLPVAIVVSSHGTNGTLFVRVNSIDENHAKVELALKANINSPTLVTPNIGVATGTSFNSITGLSATTPLMDGTAAVGTAVTVARGDHKHPTDTSRQATITGAATTITSANLTVSRTLVSDTNGKVAVSNVTGVELGYLSGVTSSVQTQINSKAPLISPTFTGTPVAPTASVGTSTAQIATTAYVVAEVNKIEEW